MGWAVYVRYTDLMICLYGSNLPALLKQRVLSFRLNPSGVPLGRLVYVSYGEGG